jgi:hypothetical protein
VRRRPNEGLDWAGTGVGCIGMGVLLDRGLNLTALPPGLRLMLLVDIR